MLIMLVRGTLYSVHPTQADLVQATNERPVIYCGF
jgi:hypothetical protein